MPGEVRFGRLAHLITVPVRVGTSPAVPFVLDTGIGVNLVAKGLAARLGLRRSGATYTGRRMSGQSIEVPLLDPVRLRLGSTAWDAATAGEIDLAAWGAPMAGIGGFLSLGLFERHLLRVDPRAQTLRIRPAGDPGRPDGTPVPVRVERDGPSVCAFTRLRLPPGDVAEVEVDSGSDSLILDDRYRAGLRVPDDGPSVRRVEARDETGHAYVRRFARLRGRVRLDLAPAIAQRDPEAIFQTIIHDGLLGDAFLRRWSVTYDLAGERIWFRDPGPRRARTSRAPTARPR